MCLYIYRLSGLGFQALGLRVQDFNKKVLATFVSLDGSMKSFYVICRDYDMC